MEGGEGNVADGTVGGEDEMFDIGGFEFGFEGFDEGVVEGLAGGFELADVAGFFELVAEAGNGGGEGFGGDVGFKGSKDDAALVGFEGEEELDFVFEDEGIDEDGAVLSVDDAAGFVVEFFGVEAGAFGGVVIGEEFTLRFEFFVDGGIEFISLAFELSECWTVIFFAFAELLAEVSDRTKGFENFGEGIFFDVGEADAGTVDRLCVAGEVSEFSEFEEFEDGLGFGKATLLEGATSI